MKINIILLTALLLLKFNISSAQVGAVKKAEKRVADRIVEKTFDGIFNKLFGSDSTKTAKDPSVKTDSTVTANSRPFGGLFSAKTVDKKYRFNLTLDMELINMDGKGGSDVTEMMAHYSTDSAYVGTEMQDVFNIMDFTEMKNYSLIGGKVTVISLQSFIDKANRKAKKKEDEDEVDHKFRKTGRTEVIAGYKCEEYTSESEDLLGSYWLTEEIGVNSEAYAKTFAASPTFIYPEVKKGIVLKMILQDPEKGTTTKMITKEVIREPHTYDLSKYKATDLSRIRF